MENMGEGEQLWGVWLLLPGHGGWIGMRGVGDGGVKWGWRVGGG